MSGTIEEAVNKALCSKNIPRGEVRVVDKNMVRMRMLGASNSEIAKELGVTPETVSYRLDNPKVKEEIERLDILTDKELIKLTMASKRRMLEASLKAADELCEMIEGETLPGLKLKAIIKVLEYAHGKPHQSISLPGKGDKPLSERGEMMIDKMILTTEEDSNN